MPLQAGNRCVRNVSTRIDPGNESGRREKSPGARALVPLFRQYPPRRYCTALIMSNMGRYMATTMPPITTPITTIMIGSRIEVSALTAASTSSS